MFIIDNCCWIFSDNVDLSMFRPKIQRTRIILRQLINNVPYVKYN